MMVSLYSILNSFQKNARNLIFNCIVYVGHVPEVNMKDIRPFIQLPYFNAEEIIKKNSAAAGLCSWVINIVNYYDIVQQGK